MSRPTHRVAATIALTSARPRFAALRHILYNLGLQFRAHLAFRVRQARQSAQLPVLALALLLAPSVSATTITAVNSGSWASTTTWSPSQVPTSADDVIIGNGTSDVTVNVAANAVANTLSFSTAGNQINTVTLNPSVLLNVSGSVTIGSPASAGAQSILDVGSGILAGFDFNISPSSPGTSKLIIGSGSASPTTSVNFSGNAANAQLTFTGAGLLYVPEDLSSGGTLTTFAGSTIRYTGSASSSVGPYATYANLEIAKVSPATATLAGSITVNGNFSLLGTLDLSSNSMTVVGNAHLYPTSPTTTVNGTGTLTLNGGAAPTLDGSGIFNAPVTFGPGSRSVLSSSTLTFNGAMTVNGDLTDIPSSSTLTLNGSSAVANSGSLVLNGGVLTGAGDLTVNGSMSFSSGTLTGAGNLNIAATGTMSITGSGSNKVLDSRTINNSGTINYDSTGSVFVQGTTVINNLAGANYNIQSDGFFAFNGGSPQFNNSGTVTRNTANGVSTFGLAFANSNAVNVQTGTLSFDRGGSATGGTFSVSSGTTLRFGVGSSFPLDASSSISGAGSVEVSGADVSHSGSYNIAGGTTASGGTLTLTGTVSSLGPIVVSGGILDLSSTSALSTASLSVTGGQLKGSSSLTVNGPTTFSSGTIAGSGTLVIPVTRTMSITGSGSNKVLDSRTINNSGTINYDSVGSVFVQGPTVINNLSGGNFNLQSDGFFAFNGGSPQFNNSGTLTRNTATGTITFGLALANNNAVDVQTGLLSLDRGGSATAGTFSVSSGATLRFGSQSFAFDAATSIAGSGSVETSGASVTHPGSYNIIGGTTSSNGSFTLTGTVSNLGPVTVSGGLLTLSSASSLSTSSLSITSGTLAGSSTLTVNGSTTFSGGSIMGSGTLAVPATRTMSITGGGAKFVDSRTINNSGSIIFDSAGSTFVQGTTVINNLSGATYDIRSDTGLTFNGGSPQFNNSGTVEKTSGTGTSSIGPAMDNQAAGTIIAQIGTINLTSLTQNGTLSFPISGATGYGTINVGSPFTLAGTLTATTTGGYTPVSGTTFPVMTFSGLPGGAFTTKNLTYSGGHFTDATSASALTLTAVSSCDPVPAGAISWYRAEGNAVDSVGINNGALAGGATTASGYIGNAFSLNGTTAYVSVPDSPSLRPSSVTAEMWVKLNALPGSGWYAFVSKPVGSGTNDSFSFGLNSSGEIGGVVGNGSAQSPLLTSAWSPVIGTWYHVAQTYDSTSQTHSFFINGTLVASQNAGVALGYDAQPFLIGADIESGSLTYFSHALIDDVTIYDRALTAGEIADLYTAGSTGKCFSPSAPSISGLSPASGAIGTPVTITGTDLIGTSAVAFNGTAATYTVDSATQISTTVPAGATTGIVSATTAAGTATSSGNFTVSSIVHWINASGGTWNVGSNWSTGLVPSAADNVAIDASGTYTVSLDVTPLFNSLTIGGGATGTQTLADTSARDIALSNPGTIAANGALTLSSGRLLGPATLTVNGALHWNADSEILTTVAIAAGASMNISGSGTRQVNGGTINNFGTVNWSGANNISVYNSGVVNNRSGGLFSVTNDQFIFQHCCTAGQAFSNDGTFRKTVATGTTTIPNNGFDNTGTVDIQSGTFNPSSGGTSSGIFNATASGSFLFSNGVYTLSTGATLTGAGNFQITGGQLNVSAAGLSVDHMTMSGGNLNINATGSVSTAATGIVDWNADATLSGAGPLTISTGGTLNISGSGTRYIDGGLLNNNGTVNWTGANNISIYDAGIINNLATGLFSVKNDQQIYMHCCSAGQPFNNVGTFRKSVATGTTTIQNNGFNNSGTVDIQSGTFNPTSGGTSTAVFNALASGTVLFSNNTYTLGAGATLTGSGNFQVSGGQLTVNATGVTVGHLTMNGGILSIAGAVSTSATGVVDWSADATLTGTGALTITTGGTMNITGSGTRYIGGGTLNNAGTVNWSGTNNISIYDSGIIHNQLSGLFSVKNDQLIYQHCCAAGLAFDNAGTFRKSVATGTTNVQSNGFTNTGTVDIQSGTFNPSSGGTSTAVFGVASGATILFNNNTYTLNAGATLTGSGNFQISGGTLLVNATGVTVDHMTMNGGTLNVAGAITTSPTGVVDWSADAVLSGAGTLTVGSGGTMNITGAGTRSIDGGTLSNGGTVNWSGANNISVYNSGVINNQAGGLFSVKNDQLIYQHCCGAGQSFNNIGTFRKSVATGTTTIQNNSFTNTGTVDIQSGTFNPSSGGTSSAIFSAASGGTFLFTNNNYTLNSGATLTGSGNYQLGGAQVIVNATGVTVDHLTLNSGTLNVAGSVSTSATGIVDWNADSLLTGTGSLTIGNGGTMNISGAGTRYIGGGTLNNDGTINWSGGNNISVYDSGVINNQAGGLFSLTNDQLIYQHCCGAGQAFNNAGTFRKTVAAGTTTVQSNAFANSGTIEAGSGVIAFNSTFTNSGSPVYDFGIGGASTYGHLTFGNPVTLSGALIAAPVNSFVPQGGQQFQIIAFPSGSATFSPKTLTFGSSPARSFTDTYSPTAVTLTASGPAISAPLSPNQGPDAGGTAVTITGSGFVSGGSLAVTFGGTAATSVVVVNPTTITCVTASHAPGLVDVVITNGDGQPTTATGAYTYNLTVSTDVGVTASASPSTVADGSTFSYATLVTNHGPAIATNVVATIALPANVALNGPPSSTQGACSGTTTIVCTIGTMPVNGTATQTINVTANGAGIATANASVTATESDTSAGNNNSNATVTINGGSTLAVTTNADSGIGSLRQAIINANNGAVCTSPCAITFNLPGGQLTIAPPTSLPVIAAPNVTIDATTQPGYAGTPLITLDGSGNASVSSGLHLSGGHDAVKGLSIVSFQGPAIAIDTAGNDIVSGNYLGIHADGTTAGQNAGNGVLVTAGNNTIGGTTAAAGNVISGNFDTGVLLNGVAASGNTISGNYIGTNAAGTAAVANQADGIGIILGASNNTIGGPSVGQRNVISGNFNAGIYILGDSSTSHFASGNIISGNYIGTDVSGTSGIANANGFYLSEFVSNNTIGGVTPGAGNVIAFNNKGVVLENANNGNVILHNAMHHAAVMPIDLENNGPTPNDPGDADGGSNGSQNTPVFVDATLAGSTLTTHVGVDSASVPATLALLVEVFKSDATGTQAPLWLGSQCFAGNTLTGATLTIASAPVAVGDKLVATATSYADAGCTTPGDGTSELSSAPATVAACTPPAATITPGGPTTFCTGGSVNLTASSGASYQWRNFGTPIIGATAQVFNATTSGSYSVTVSDAAGCSATSSSVSVTANSTVNVTISAGGPTTFCAGGSVTLTANPSGGSGSFASYQWLLNGSPIGGANGISRTVTSTGNYTVTVTDSSGCTGSSASTSVTVNPNPLASISGPSSICPGSSATLDAGAAFASYNWSTGAITQTITVSPSATTTYNVTVTNAAGCSASASKTLTIASSAATTTVTAPASVAANSAGNTASVPVAQPGSTYAWSITGGTITNGSGTPSITWTAGASGNVTISIVVTSASCTASGSATVAVTESADLALAATAAPNPVGAGGLVTFTLTVANNGPNPATNVRITNNLSGVTAPNATGNGWSCTTSNLTIVCTTASLPPGPAPSLTVTATASGPISAGDVASIVADTADPDGNNSVVTAQSALVTQPSCNGSAPALTSPAAGASNLASLVTFTWSASASALSYDLWIGSSGAAPAIAATTQATTAMVSLPSGPTTWYVAAHFAGDCPTLFSAPRDLSVAASADCTHGAPRLVAPSPNAVVNTPVAFTWTPAAQAVGYRLWVAIDGGPSQDAGTTNGATSLTVPLTGSSVQWHVDAIFPGCNPTSSASASFAIAAVDACGNHGKPSLLVPAAGATVSSSIVDLQWSAVSNANGYRIWAGINGADLTPIGTTTTATTLHATFSNGSVAWFVEALFNGCASSPSAQSSFTVPAAANCDNAAPAPLAPANNATLGNSEVDFSWSSVPHAIGYELWLALNNGTPSPAGSTTATSLRRTVGAGAIEWFVRALFNGCPPAESAHARFSFAPPADCALIRPILTAPADGAGLVFSPVDLRWSNVPGATQYKVWLAGGDGTPVVIGTTSATHLDNQSVPTGSVSWFVEALFDHCPNLESTLSTFTAAPPPQPCTTPGVPLPRAESTASTNVEYLIRWTPAGPSATTQYELQESTDPAFTAPLLLTITASEWPFKHINNGDAAVPYYYRVRAIDTCKGARSLFSLPLTVQVLPSNVTDPNSANGSTPADNPQTTRYEIHIGGTTTANATQKGAIAATSGDTFTATTNQTWLTVSPSSGTVPAEGTTLHVTAKTEGLPVGTSNGAVTVAFGAASGSSNRAALDTKPASNTTVSVNLVQPVSPTAKSGPPPDALIIPAVAHADGINSRFQSDIRVTNSSAQPMKYQVTFVPTGDAGIAQGKQTTVDIDPGTTIALDDVLQSWFGDNAATGTLEVRPLTAAPTSSTATALPNGLANILTFASSRTYNTTSNGTFGQYIPAIPFAAFVGRAADPTKSTILSLQQIAQSPAFRTNLGIVEGSGDPASVLISVFGDNGQKLTEFTQDLKGGQHVQLNSILATKNVQVTDGRIEVKVVSPVGKVTAYASVLDNVTNDPLLVSPVAVNQTAAARYVIPGVADLNNGIANWQTDVRVFNPSTNIVKATLTFYSQGGGTPQTKDIQLAPGQVQTLDATLRNLFGISNDGGALHIATTATTPLVATARTYNQTANGTYGQFIPAVTANDAAALGTRPLQLLQIEESDRYRTNVGFAEVTGKAATIEVTAVPSNSKVAASTQIQMAANQFIQYPQLLRSMGLTDNYNARISVKVISGQGRVTAYASVIDMKTNDPTYVPAQ